MQVGDGADHPESRKQEHIYPSGNSPEEASALFSRLSWSEAPGRYNLVALGNLRYLILGSWPEGPCAKGTCPKGVARRAVGRKFIFTIGNVLRNTYTPNFPRCAEHVRGLRRLRQSARLANSPPSCSARDLGRILPLDAQGADDHEHAEESLAHATAPSRLEDIHQTEAALSHADVSRAKQWTMATSSSML